MIGHINEAEDAITNIRDDWAGIQASYDAYRAVLSEAGVPMHLDEEGKPASEGEPRDLIDGLLHLASRCREAEKTAADLMRAIPERCPVTGMEFSCVEEHPEKGPVALYRVLDEHPLLFSIPEYPWDSAIGKLLHEQPIVHLAYHVDSRQWEEPATCAVRLIHVHELDRLQKEASCAKTSWELAEDCEKRFQRLEAAVAQERDDMAEQLAEAHAEVDARKGLAKELLEAHQEIRALRGQRNLMTEAIRDIASEWSSGWLRTVRWETLEKARQLANLSRNGDGAP